MSDCWTYLGERLLEEVVVGVLLRGVSDHVLEQQLVSGDTLDGHDQTGLHAYVDKLVQLLLTGAQHHR